MMQVLRARATRSSGCSPATPRGVRANLAPGPEFAHASCTGCRQKAGATRADRPNQQERPMPRDFNQGLFFMLGFLLVFYVLLPLLGVSV